MTRSGWDGVGEMELDRGNGGSDEAAKCKWLVVKCIHFIIGIMFTKPINTGNRFVRVVIVSLRFVLLDDSY